MRIQTQSREDALFALIFLILTSAESNLAMIWAISVFLAEAVSGFAASAVNSFFYFSMTSI